MEFNPTNYQLMNVSSSNLFEDENWTLDDPQSATPSLIRAVYEQQRFVPRDDLKGIYRYANWLPIKRVLEDSCAPVTYKSRYLAEF